MSEIKKELYTIEIEAGWVGWGEREAERETKRSEISKNKMPGRGRGGHKGGHCALYPFVTIQLSLDIAPSSPACSLSSGLCELSNKDLFPVLGSLPGLVWPHCP